MGIFFEKPVKGPDNFGGIWPIKDTGKCINRCGRTVSRGEVVQLALTPGEASEVATNDANSYTPGKSNDTVWNTVIDPIASTTVGSSINRGGIWGVCLDAEVSDNTVGTFQFFGLCTAYVVRSNTTVTTPGSPLTVRVTGTGAPCFDPIILSNEVVVAMFESVTNGAMTTRRLHNVFLHNGLFYQVGGQTSS